MKGRKGTRRKVTKGKKGERRVRSESRQGSRERVEEEEVSK